MVSRQATRYLCLAVIFAVSGYLLWRGDDWHIGTTPAHYVGYLIAAIGVAGLLGLNIWWGPLDKRRDADSGRKDPQSRIDRDGDRGGRRVPLVCYSFCPH